MKVKILFDKYTLDKNLYTGWGVSFLVGDRILFDTGENGQWLIANMKNLKVELNKLKAVVISHDHWDHSRGLWKLLEQKHPIDVYGCPKFSNSFKKNVKMYNGNFIENDTFAEIEENIYVTGEISGRYSGIYMPEQALLVKTDKGITVITGCAHPGIVKMLEAVRRKFSKENFYFVFGGFHLMGSSGRTINGIVEKFREMKIEKVGPTHCTGPEAERIFAKEYKDDFISIKTGETLEI